MDATVRIQEDDHANSIRWLVSCIEVTYCKEPATAHDIDDESPNQMLKRRMTGIEPRWWTAVFLFTAVWMVMLYVFGIIADNMSHWPNTRFTVLVVYIAILIWVSREFGARFRALNDRSKYSHETTWAMLCGWLMIGIISVISEPMKNLASDLKRYDTMTAVALVSWIYLYNAALKLPWDKATEQRKVAHMSWSSSMARLSAWSFGILHRILEDIKAPRDETLHASYHFRLAMWDSLYPDWRPSWKRVQSASVIARYDRGHMPGNTCLTAPSPAVSRN